MGVDGGNGVAGASGDQGGGGGAHGLVVTTNSTLTTSVAGGNGGAGGNGLGDAGGGGGAGGYGVVVNGANATVNAAMTGGKGGAGGTSQNPFGANGGDGGFGIAGVGLSTITNNSTITGGNGGAGGTNVGCCPALGGNGAAGVSVTFGSTLVNSATIIGGNGGAGGNTTDINNTAPGGNGGNGGAGVTGANATIRNSGAITGGTGGAAGTGITNGSAGTSGVGISGSDLTITNSGSISGTSGANAITFTGGANFLNLQGGWSLTGNIAVDGSSSLSFTQTASVALSNVITGTGGIAQIGTGTLTLSASNTYSGGTIVNAGTLQLSGPGTLGATSGTTTVNTGGTLDLGGTTQTQAALNLAGGTLQNGSLNAPITSTGGIISGISGTASLNVTGGTTLVSGIDTFTGGTTVTNATLTVNGSLSDPTIGAGGLLNGTGSVGATTIQSGGTFAPGSGAPGTSMTVNGNLALQSGSTYQVAVNPSTASFVNVTGKATLSGATVNAAFASGSYISKQYTILTAGSVSGSFGTLTNANLPSNFTDTLSYDKTHAYLNLMLNFTPPSGPTAPSFGGGLNLNQQAVANTLVNFFNTTGGIPMAFGALTPAGLTQASGELATGSQQTTFDAMNLFMGLLTDPFMNRIGGVDAMPGASSFAEEGDASAYAATKKTDAFAMFTKAPPAPFVQRWSVWAAGFGGSQSTSGNAIVGSNDTTSSVYGTAVGADLLFSPDTIAGFALAGGGTSFSVAGSGSGRSDLFQAGVHIRHTEGPAYISASLAYGWQDITTNRTVTAAGIDQLRAEFNANAYSGRVEGGYRFVAPWTGVGITPYAAGQFTTFDLPGYAEQVVSGLPTFALGYAGKSVTDARSELGVRTDKSFLVQDGILTLRTRFAWAHDYDPNRSIAATFQALPGASFVVNGAAQASDSALTTASIEMKWRSGWSAAATFEGEFSAVTSSYAGKGVVRYQW
ncbi:autotransporter outer membrane beta-barrel domain-containing protein [Bradyrhizobium sp. LTSPM299]|uniref:autotransporter outer membrane beta-barrel domain-containing protein n=1 Tax=Bradyrhizobium sp. LTSPM299 TaxID=1619233 RepID=UPI000AA95166|nr:autotransporter outer membrane beta-barrel domain-containing protein [Bradyrhizobium sp. LTSPM299]